MHYFDGGLCDCVQETVEELESTSTRLRETEHTLSCTKTVLHRAATERPDFRVRHHGSAHGERGGNELVDLSLHALLERFALGGVHCAQVLHEGAQREVIALGGRERGVPGPRHGDIQQMARGVQPSVEPTSREIAEVTVTVVCRELLRSQKTRPENRHA